MHLVHGNRKQRASFAPGHRQPQAGVECVNLAARNCLAQRRPLCSFDGVLLGLLQQMKGMTISQKICLLKNDLAVTFFRFPTPIQKTSLYSR